MKKMFFIMCLCVFFVAHAPSAEAAGCYITPTGDYICDRNNPKNQGYTTERDLRQNVPGSGYVYRADNLRIQDGWRPRVLNDMEYEYIEPDLPPDDGDDMWEPIACNPDEDPEEAAMQHILTREGFVEQSYYDGFGSEGNCSYSYKTQGDTCGSKRPYCGDCASGCLTVCVGHLVLESEMDTYSPCGTTFTKEYCTTLFRDSDFPKYWDAAVNQTQAMCLSAEEAACFSATLASVAFQHGTAWHTNSGKQRYMNNVWDSLKAGEFNQAATDLMASSWCEEEPSLSVRCFDLVAGIQELANSGVEGCDGVANN